MGDSLCQVVSSSGGYPSASVLCGAYGMCYGTPTPAPADACVGVGDRDSRNSCVRAMAEYGAAGVPAEALRAMSAVQTIACGSDIDRVEACVALRDLPSTAPGVAEIKTEMREFVRCPE